MRTFKQIEEVLGLKIFFETSNGALYFPHDKSKDIIIRQFNESFPKEFIPILNELTIKIAQWVEQAQELNELVTVAQPIEVGIDFIIRPWHVYYTSIRDYLNPKKSIKRPKEYKRLKKVMAAMENSALSPKEILFLSILSRSLLIPTGKTYFNGKKFVVVEPKIYVEDLRAFKNENDVYLPPPT